MMRYAIYYEHLKYFASGMIKKTNFEQNTLKFYLISLLFNYYHQITYTSRARRVCSNFIQRYRCSVVCEEFYYSNLGRDAKYRLLYKTNSLKVLVV